MADSETITLPSGGTATLRTAGSFRYGDKRRIRETALTRATANGGNGYVYLYTVTDEVAKTLVTAWELPYLPDAPLPSQDPDVFDRLEIGDAEAILDEALKVREVLFPPAATPDDADKPGSP